MRFAPHIRFLPYIHTSFLIMIYCKEPLKQNERVYKLFIRSYYNLEDLLSTIENLKNYISHYACISHDKEGTPHFHALLTFKQPISPLNIYTRLDLVSSLDNQNTEFEKPIDMLACFDYLVHKRDLDKYQYNYADIISDNISHFQKNIDNQYERNLEFINDLLVLDFYDMAVKYGKDYIRNYNSYNSFKQLLKTNENLVE